MTGVQDIRAAGTADRLRWLGSLAGTAVERFPAATLFVILFALLANRLVALPSGGEDADWRLLLGLGGAGAAATAVHLAAETRALGRLPAGALATAAGAALAALVVHSAVPLVEMPLLLLAAMLAVPVAPFLGKSRDANAYWMFLVWGSVGAGLAFVAVMVSISGLTTALELVRLFFGFGLSFEAYSHVYVTAFGLVGPLFALGSLPATGPAALRFSSDDRLIRMLRPLLEWIAPVLLLLQGLVLHLYAPLALLGAEGRLDAAILASSFLAGVLALRVLVAPFVADIGGAGRLFVRFWPWLVPVPLLVILVAGFAAAGTSGIDETGYMLFATAFAVAVLLLFQAVPRLRGDVVAIAALPVLFMLVAAAGPLSLANVVGRSQAAFIEGRYGAAIRGEGTLSNEDMRSLRRAVTTLAELRQLDRVAPVIGEARLREVAGPQPGSSSAVADRLLLLLGLPEEDLPETRTAEALRTLDGGGWGLVSADGYDTLAFGLPLDTGDGYFGEDTDPSIRAEGTVLVIRAGGEEDRVDLRAAIEAIPAELFDAGRVETPVVDLVTVGGRSVGMRVDYLSLDAEDRPQGGRLTLLLRSADWASLRRD